MASQPPEAPETIILGSFAGIKNTVGAERLQPSELAAAVNVDLDDAGQLRRRRGYERRHTGNHHSLIDVGGRCFVVRDGVLGELSEDLSFREILPVGPTKLCYVRVGPVVYFSSETIAGKIVNGQYQPWGEQRGPQWLSPVMRPTDTLGEVAGKVLRAPPRATAMGHYKGRIYLAAGPVLWATELYNYEAVDATRNFMPFEDDITMVAPVGDGIYIGTTRDLQFIQGTLADGLERRTIFSYGVVPGSLVQVPYSRVDPRARDGRPMPEGEGPVFLTAGGVCLGLENGDVFNLTQGRVVFPEAVSAAALYREDQGANAYVAVTDSAGGPAANARIGDYVDAEIVRASQRG